MKTLGKLALLLLMANALYQFVPPYWNFTQFKWAVKERALEWREQSEAEVGEQVLRMAGERNVPIGAEHIQVRREREHLFIRIGYTQPIEFVPTVKRDWTFETSIDAWTAAPIAPISR